MGKYAKVQDVEALKAFRLQLLTFAEKAGNAIGEADSEVARVTSWVENEMSTHWTSEVRKRQAAVVKAKEDLRFKQLFKSPSGGKQSTVDEEKALAKANARLAEAEQKVANVKKWIRQLHKEGHMYRGAVQRLNSTVSVDIPNAAAKINRMVASLEQYINLSAPNLGPAAAGGGDGSMASAAAGGIEVGGFKALRKYTPNAAAKDQAPKGQPPASWAGAAYADGDAARIEAISADRSAPDRAATVIIAQQVGSAKKVYLERSAPAFPGDSGWYVGPADAATPAERVSVSVEALVAARPHLDDLLSFPVGTLAVLDTAGVAAVLNGADEDLFAPPAPGDGASAEASAAPAAAQPVHQE